MKYSFSKGFNLIELMISLTIAIILITAIFLQLQHSGIIFIKEQTDLREREHIHYAQFTISRAIRMAGYFGCHTMRHTHPHSSLYHNNAFNTSITQSIPFHMAIIAYPALSKPPLPSAIRARLKKNSDVLFVRYLSPDTMILKENMSSLSAPIAFQNLTTFKVDQILAITDCEHADIFAISNIKHHHIFHERSTLNKINVFIKRYKVGAEFGKIESRLFYLRKSQHSKTGYALFVQEENGQSHELVTDIDNMLFQFSTNSAPNNFVDSAHIYNWLSVKKVKVLLTFTKDNTIDFILSLRNQ